MAYLYQNRITQTSPHKTSSSPHETQESTQATYSNHQIPLPTQGRYQIIITRLLPNLHTLLQIRIRSPNLLNLLLRHQSTNLLPPRRHIPPIRLWCLPRQLHLLLHRQVKEPFTPRKHIGDCSGGETRVAEVYEPRGRESFKDFFCDASFGGWAAGEEGVEVDDGDFETCFPGVGNGG